jgi:hypothetical protein
MPTPDVWVAKDDGSEIVRAGAIAAVGRDYNGTVTARLSGGGEGSAVTLVAVAPHQGKHTPDGFHRQLIQVVAQLSDAAGAALVRPVWDEPHGWHRVTEPL